MSGELEGHPHSWLRQAAVPPPRTDTSGPSRLGAGAPPCSTCMDALLAWGRLSGECARKSTFSICLWNGYQVETGVPWDRGWEVWLESVSSLTRTRCIQSDTRSFSRRDATRRALSPALWMCSSEAHLCCTGPLHPTPHGHTAVRAQRPCQPLPDGRGPHARAPAHSRLVNISRCFPLFTK